MGVRLCRRKSNTGEAYCSDEVVSLLKPGTTIDLKIDSVLELHISQNFVAETLAVFVFCLSEHMLWIPSASRIHYTYLLEFRKKTVCP